MKKLFTAVLLAASFAFGSVLAAELTSGVVADTALQINVPADRIIVYYLYVTPRCQTCLDIEAFSHEAITSAFAQEIEKGLVEWHAYDTGIPEYAHYWDDFELVLKSLVVTEVKNGERVRWKICDKVWDLVEDKPAFLSYVQKEIQAYLGRK